MVKRALLALGLVSLLGAGYALGAGMTVTLTANGPDPRNVTIGWGDTVTFTNADDKPHAVEIPRLSTESPEIPSGGTFQQVFDGRRGNYLFRQRGGGGPNTTASIIVDVPGTVTLVTSASVIDYGKSLRLSGKSSYPGTPVKIVQRAPGSGTMWVPVSTVTAAADGSYSLEVEPKLGARFRAQVAADQLLSDPVLISVRPILTVRTTARRTKTGRQITVIGRVTPAKAATSLDLERYDPRRRRWFTQAKGRVRASGGVTFKWKATKGVSRLRVAVKPLSLSGGWAPAASTFVTVTAI
jgi:plastocyanin